jgi:UDPglucose--hexose-1-phosphate uridylyltransferase
VQRVVDVRRDPLTGTEVVFAPERALRPELPTNLHHRPTIVESCPFCPGNEKETAAEVDSEGRYGRDPDTPGWQVRVFANRYPAFDAHDVLVFSPQHNQELGDLTDAQVALCLAVAARRLRKFRALEGVEAVMFIINEGRGAGASLEHPHGQLVGLPVAPAALVAEMPGSDGRCKVCLSVELERRGPRVVHDEGAFAFAPWASAWPYQTIIAPPHLDPFEHSGSHVLYDVGRALRRVLCALRKATDGAPYNVVVHSGTGHWHVHVIPRIPVLGGIELGSGVRINYLDPDDGAEQLRTHVPV